MPMSNPKTAKRSLTAVSSGNGSKVDYYNVGDKVLEMKKNGFSITEITDYCNTELLKEEGQYLSRMAVQRYIQKNLRAYKEFDQRKGENSTINELNELMEMLEYTEGQLDTLEKCLNDVNSSAKVRRGFTDDELSQLTLAVKSGTLDPSEQEKLLTMLEEYEKVSPFTSSKDITALVNSSEKTLARRQSILANIIQWKEKVLTFTSLQKVVSTLMTKVKERDVASYVDTMEEFDNDPVIQECFKHIPKISAKVLPRTKQGAFQGVKANRHDNRKGAFNESPERK